MPKTTYEKRSWRAVRVNERALKTLYDLFNRESKKKPSLFTVKLSDDATIEGLTIEELLSLPNSSTRAFREITLSNSSFEDPALRLHIHEDAPPVRYSVSGQDDKQVSYVHGEIEKVINDCRQPVGYFFSLPHGHDLAWWMITTMGGLILVGIAGQFSSIALLIVGLIVFNASWTWALLRKFLMPRVTFEIGEGIERSARFRDRRTQVLWVVIIGAIVAIPIGLLVSYLYDHLK